MSISASWLAFAVLSVVAAAVGGVVLVLVGGDGGGTITTIVCGKKARSCVWSWWGYIIVHTLVSCCCDCDLFNGFLLHVPTS